MRLDLSGVGNTINELGLKLAVFIGVTFVVVLLLSFILRALKVPKFLIVNFIIPAAVLGCLYYWVTNYL